MFTPTDLRRVVDETFVRLVDYHDELPSTNDRALRILPEWREKLPALIVAGQQTAGRGRNQNKWWAAPGALTFSLLAASIKQANLPSPWPALSMWTAIALRNALVEFIPTARVQLKWPNDVFVNGRKVSGVLVESHNSQSDLAVVGVGINVNNSISEAPDSSSNDDWRSQAISMRSVAGDELPLVDVLIGILKQIEYQWKKSQINPTSLAGEWRDHCFLTGRTIRWSSGTREITGVCCGVEEDGAVSINVNGQQARCYGGVVNSY